MPLRILVVEDDIPTLELISEVLKSQGVVVRSVSDSRQAAQMINQEKFDGIFLDLMMPEVDGFELARQIRRSSWNRRTPIVTVTGQEEKGTMEEAFGAGATFFLQKPVDRTKLVRLLNSTRGTMVEERRRFKRISIQTQVTCKVDSREIRGMSSNLSQDGILFQGDGSFRTGIAVQLSFAVPQHRIPIELRGVVVRIDERKRAAVQFTQINTEDRHRIRELVASQVDAA